MKKLKNNPNEIRESVSKEYAKAVSSNQSCCGSSPKGVTAKIAGYKNEDLEGLPQEAVVNSFGCGNPLAFSGVKEGDVVLDLGSGAGIDLLIAAKKVGPGGKVIGVDMTDKMIEKARSNIEASGFKNIEVRKGIIESLPVESESVDWVISNCVINLSPQKDKVFSEIARVLRKNGTMLVSDIVAKDLPDEIKNNSNLYSACISGAISEEEYLQGLVRAGLSKVEVKDRLHYDKNQLEAFVGSEIDGKPSCSCCGSSNSSVAKKWAKELEGKIWSVKVSAKKG